MSGKGLSFNDAMQEVAHGGIVRRAKWAPGVHVSRQGYLFKMQDGKDFVPAFESVRSDDWEIVTYGALGPWFHGKRMEPKAKAAPNLGPNALSQINSDIAFIKNKICIVKSRKEVNGLSADMVELPALRTTEERIALLFSKKSNKRRSDMTGAVALGLFVLYLGLGYAASMIYYIIVTVLQSAA